MSSLHDIFMQRAAIKAKNDFGPSNFEAFALAAANTASDVIVRRQDEKKALRDEEALFQKNLDRVDKINTTSTGKIQASISNGKIKVEPRKIKNQVDLSNIKTPEGFKIKSINAEGNASFEPLVPGESGLSTDQLIQGRVFARQKFGVRGAENALPSIYKALQEGTTIDQLDDKVRFAQQSEAFQGPVRNAAQSLVINKSERIQNSTLDFIDDELAKGNTEAVQNQLKKVARDNGGTELKKQILGKERTVEFIEEIGVDLDKLAKSGITTNIFTGTVEEINAKIGKVKDLEARKVAQKISLAIINYRRSISGAQFSVPESKEYQAIFPSIGKTGEFNLANIQALTESIDGDLRSFYSLEMGDSNYRAIFEGNALTQESKTNGTTQSGNTFRRVN